MSWEKVIESSVDSSKDSVLIREPVSESIRQPSKVCACCEYESRFRFREGNLLGPEDSRDKERSKTKRGADSPV